MTNFFITGTDTGVGKTRVTITIMAALKNAGFDVVGMKPVASGAQMINGKLINDDAKLIQKQCSHSVSYEAVNPFVFRFPAAPHIAAELEHKSIDHNQIIKNYHALDSASDILIMEGIGGWEMSLNEEYTLPDLVESLNLAVILVVGLRLGCINHAILTAQSIAGRGIKLCGWGSNHLDKEYLTPDQTIMALKKRINCPHIADLPYNPNFDLDNLSTKVSSAFISQI